MGLLDKEQMQLVRKKAAAACADVPMVEFWGETTEWTPPGEFGGYPTHVGAVGRAYGRTVIATEAFTGGPAVSRWTVAPCDLKDCGVRDRPCDADEEWIRDVEDRWTQRWLDQKLAIRPDPESPAICAKWWWAHSQANAAKAKADSDLVQMCDGSMRHASQLSDAEKNLVAVGIYIVFLHVILFVNIFEYFFFLVIIS